MKANVDFQGRWKSSRAFTHGRGPERRSRGSRGSRGSRRNRGSRGSGCICLVNPLPLAAPLCAVRISLLSELQQVGEQGAAAALTTQAGASDGGHGDPPCPPPPVLELSGIQH